MKFSCLPFLFLFYVANAQKAVPIDSVTQLEEVVLIDALKSKKVIGITPSEVISAKTFQNYSPVDMVSSINQIPGVYILSGALNTNRITIRGMGARTLFGTDKLRLYYNGIPVTNGTGTSTIEAYDLENLAQIEVVKGPKGTELGANLGGAILLTPKIALGLATNLSTNFTLGSYGLIKNNTAFNHYDGKLRLNLQYGHMETDGYRQNSRFERDGFLLNTSYEVNEKTKISFLANHIDYTAQIPSSLGLTDFLEDPVQATFTWRESKGYETNNQTFLGLSLQHGFSGAFTNTTSIFYTYLDKTEARPFGILEEITNGFGFRTLFEGRFQFLEKQASYSFGGELYKDEYDWDEFENRYRENAGNGSVKGEQFARNKEFRSQWNAFSTLLLPFTSSFSAQMGLNLNKTDFNLQDRFNPTTTNKSGSRNFDPILLPSLNLSYTLSDKLQIFGNISRGFTNPSLERTLAPDGIINPDIKQEMGTSYELGTNLVLAQQRLRMQVTAYQMNIRNLLIREQVGDDAFIEKNAGSSKHPGLEFNADYLLQSANTKIQWNPFVNYNLNLHRFTDFVDAGNDFSKNELTGVPKHKLTLGIQHRFFTHYFLNLVFQHVGSIPLTDANDAYSDPFNLVNLRGGYRKKLTPNFTLGFNLGINNIFNVLYARSVLINTQGFGGAEPRYYYPGNNRNYYGGLNLVYGF